MTSKFTYTLLVSRCYACCRNCKLCNGTQLTKLILSIFRHTSTSPLVAYYRMSKTNSVQNSLCASCSVLGQAVALRRESPLLTSHPPTKIHKRRRTKQIRTFWHVFFVSFHSHPRTRAEVGDRPVDVIVTQITAPLFLTRA